jgi:hypothetical protein
VLWYRVLQEDEVGRLSLLLFLIPVLGLALAVALFGESVGPFEVTGVIATIQCARRRGEARRATTAPTHLTRARRAALAAAVSTPVHR